MKKHFIFLGVPGVIYYSWLLTVIFVAVVFVYEKDKALSLPGLILSIVFVVWAGYTWLYSYFEEQNGQYLFKLPYKSTARVTQLNLRSSWKKFDLYEIKDNYYSYFVVCVKSKKKNRKEDKA
ncbi:hypothetical protein J2Z60_001198 [Lactobacillus colini]|uniref:Pore forming protein ebsA n=1 Tax=Lactobacillus colini TaxID=1819254 RepID=A0ABS4MEB6_9LACO|nr:hypothetical protein [Lactobacillus colini]MBP2058023.1 hypothetical protein [Lactobacillus colini]